MYRKLTASLVLAVASMSAGAAPGHYDVTIAGEAPVRVTMDTAGSARVVSKKQVWNEPELIVILRALDDEGERVQLSTNKFIPGLRDLCSDVGDCLTLPTYTHATYVEYIKLLPTQQLVVVNTRNRENPAEKLVTISRVD